MNIRIKAAIGIAGLLIGIIGFLLDVREGCFFFSLALVTEIGFCISVIREENRIKSITVITRILELEIQEVSSDLFELSTSFKEDKITQLEYEHQFAVLSGVKMRLQSTLNQYS